MEKGNMPINTVIVLMLGVVVLLALVAFFLGTVNPTSNNLASESEVRAECNKYAAARCSENFQFSPNILEEIKSRAPESSSDYEAVQFVCGC